MEKLTVNQKVRLSMMLSLDYVSLDDVDVSEALDIIEKYTYYSKKLDITSLIGKTDSPILLNYAINTGDVELVKKCLYCKYEIGIFYSAVRTENSEIVLEILKLMKSPENKLAWFNYPTLCKLNHRVVLAYYELFKEQIDIPRFFGCICQYSEDETFNYFYDEFKTLDDCLQYAIESGKIERVEKLIHLYKSKYEKNYIYEACRTGNLKLVQYFTTRQSQIYNDGGIIRCACNTNNLELIHYLDNLGYKMSKNELEIPIHDNCSLPVYEWMLKNGVNPLNYEVEDCGDKLYDFMTCVENKNVKYLVVLQKYCNEKEWKKISKAIMTNWDDVFKPLLNTSMLSSCKSIELIEYILSLGKSN